MINLQLRSLRREEEILPQDMLPDLEIGCSATQPKCTFASCTPNLGTFGEAIS